ncbi:DUF4129 domain-containing protein [Streptomyces gobiensis]|uniref:DUF4129 domain-containing protein n=1 Tax=Streptomyces gobiensis TaxID=2875706 RepID=UPI001E50165E|nr:DUF4129 domain-containing protein [Streptomyces gobiensis]UGY91745.1 DUF4129 domain-containing protein [Streptomyces gobiensis]
MTGVMRRLSDDEVPVVIDRDTARDAAERELSKPMYHENDPGPLRRALDWFLERAGDLLNSAAGITPGGWVGLLTVALLVVLLIVALRLRLGALRPAPDTGDSTLFDDRPRSAAEHRAAAERHAAASRWSEAVQERMRAVVRSLEERTLLDPRPGRTADEAAAEAGQALPEHATALRTAALSFDEVTYAGRPANPSAYAELRDLDTALARTKPQLPSATAAGNGDTP